MITAAGISWRLFLTVAAVGCTASMQGGGAEATADRLPIVRLERENCFRSCPMYSLELHGDGRVIYEGRGGGALLGRHVGTAAPADVRRLVEQMERAGFASLPREYVYTSPACAPYAADAPIVVLTLMTAERVHSVRHDHGCAGAPRILLDLEQAVDSVGGVHQWVPSNPGELP